MIDSLTASPPHAADPFPCPHPPRRKKRGKRQQRAQLAASLVLPDRLVFRLFQPDAITTCCLAFTRTGCNQNHQSVRSRQEPQTTVERCQRPGMRPRYIDIPLPTAILFTFLITLLCAPILFLTPRVRYPNMIFILLITGQW